MKIDFSQHARRNPSMRTLIASFLCVVLSGCASNAARIDSLARAATMTPSLFESSGLQMRLYLRPDSARERLVIFLEGDGIPWRQGVVPNDDPTTRNPLALQLAAQTPGAIAYVARPCYQGVRTDRCSPDLWTSGRYSEQVVSAMTQAVLHTQQQAQAATVVLVGYSGGGVLAVLIAERLPHVAAVVTIAANLDVAAWTNHHGYLPLVDSLNPAMSDRDHAWREIHLVGELDDVVPKHVSDRYFERHPSAQRWELANYGHSCCWLEEWPSIWRRIETDLSALADREREPYDQSTKKSGMKSLLPGVTAY